jgi:hypothetical protein
MHMQSEGANMPDLETTVELHGDTAYSLCYFVPTNRSAVAGE